MFLIGSTQPGGNRWGLSVYTDILQCLALLPQQQREHQLEGDVGPDLTTQVSALHV